jgi:putative hydrolase of the HAD superfamily
MAAPQAVPRARPGLTLRAVLFDVDFTLAKPGPEFGPEGYLRAAERCGLTIDPSKHAEARAAALADLQKHPELEHDEEIWIAFSERMLRGMGAEGEQVRECAMAIERAWARAEHFEIYEDVLPVLQELRARGIGIGLVTNGARDLDEFIDHHGLQDHVDVAVSSRAHGRVKPHESIFRAALTELGVEPGDAAMVGDSPEDDIEGAKALGMRALLIDREQRFPEQPDRLPDLYALPPALGLPRQAV